MHSVLFSLVAEESAMEIVCVFLKCYNAVSNKKNVLCCAFPLLTRDVLSGIVSHIAGEYIHGIPTRKRAKRNEKNEKRAKRNERNERNEKRVKKAKSQRSTKVY